MRFLFSGDRRHHLPPGATQQALYLQPQGAEVNRGSLGVDDYVLNERAIKVGFSA